MIISATSQIIKNDFMEPCHTLFSKRQKAVVDYSNHSLDDFRMFIVSPYPYLTSSENDVHLTSFGSNSQLKGFEINPKQLLTCMISR